MHTTSRVVICFFVGLIAGAAATVPGVLWFLRSETGSQVLRQYVAPPPKWPSVLSESTPTQVPTVVPNTTNATTSPILVPKAFASAEYHTAINATIATFDQMQNTYTRLLPNLVRINNKSLTGDYSNFFDLVVEAKLDVSYEKDLTAKLAQNITALSAANQTTTDVVTRSSTQTLVSQGTALQTASSAFLQTLSGVLSGSVPTQQQITDLNAQASAYATAATTFAGTAKDLLIHFGMKPAGATQ